MTTGSGTDPVPATPEGAATFARTHGLDRVDRMPRLTTYLRQIWAYRAFTLELASAKAYDRNQNNYLGQIWAVLNPLLLAGAYFLVFGLLLELDRGVDNFIAFLTIGIFIFAFLSACLTAGSKAVVGNQGLIRSVRFPRAVLPIAVSISEFLILLPAIGVLVVILPLTGEPVRVAWLLVVPAVLLLFLFCTGAAMLVARVVASSRDVQNLVPLGVRLARYISGVFFSISAYAGEGVIGTAMQVQPFAVYIDLVRMCLLSEHPQNPGQWWLAAGWAVLTLAVGIILFWRAELRYGRE